MSLTKIRKFQARWTDAINEEWSRNLLKNNPGISANQLIRTYSLMNKAVPDAIVSGYDHMIEYLVLPDPNDRHVLAAAIHAEAGKIITDNTKHFPPSALSPWEIEVCRPDAFVAGLLKDYPTEVIRELKNQRARLTNPPLTVDEFLDSLRKVGLNVTASMLRASAELL